MNSDLVIFKIQISDLEFPLMDVHSQGHHGAADVEVVGEGEDGDEELPDLEGAVVEQLHRLFRQVTFGQFKSKFQKKKGKFANILNQLILKSVNQLFWNLEIHKANLPRKREKKALLISTVGAL